MHRDGRVYRQSYTVGVPDAPLAEGEATDRSGTTITFWASPDVFDAVDYDFETLRTRFQQMAFLNKGLTISLVDERPQHADVDGNPPSVTYRYDGGLVDYVKHLNASKKNDAVHPDVIDFESEDTERPDLDRDRDAVDHGVLRERAHLRQHHQHPRGRHPRGGLPRRADQAGQRLRARHAACSRRRTRTSPATTSARA